MHCVWRSIFLGVLACCYNGTLPAMPDSSRVPAAVAQQWQALQQKDALADWIYARIAYAEEAPLARLSILEGTTAAAWRSYSTYPERLAWFDVLAIQGYYQLQAGNILASIQAYEKALQFYEAYPLPEVTLIEEILKPLGNNYTRLADYDMALNIHRKALALLKDGRQTGELASIYANMAVCARWKGDLPAAAAYCTTGLSHSTRATALRGLLLTTYADILTEQDRMDSARIYSTRALQLLQSRQREEQAVYWYGSALQVAATIALRQQQVTQAAVYAGEAVALYRRHYPASKQREKAKLAVLQGHIHLAGRHTEKALFFFQEALLQLLPSWRPATMEAVPPDSLLYSENTIGDALEGKAEALRVAGRKAAALQHLVTCFAAQAKLRQQFFYAGSRLREIQLSAARSANAMQLAYTLWQETKSAYYRQCMLWIAELSKARALLDERAARMEETGLSPVLDTLARQTRHLQQVITYYRHELLAGTAAAGTDTLLQSAEHTLSRLQRQWKRPAAAPLLTAIQTIQLCRQLPAGACLLEFFEGRDSSFLIAADRSGVQSVQVIAGGRGLHDRISRFMQQWFAAGSTAMINAPKQFYTECHALYRVLFSGYQWQAGRQYLLVTDGAFSYLPFDALLTTAQYSNDFSNWPYLYKQALLSRAYSLQTWHQQQTMTYTDRQFNGFFVSAAKQGGLPVLTAATAEYGSLQQQVPGRYYLDSAATRQAFTTAVAHTGVLHVSMHATAGVMPALQFYDGPLFLADLQYTRFAPSLVVLSACRTADGRMLEGEGVNSLERGFIAAGAGGVVSGLWNVNDETAVALSALFYHYLPKEPDAATALHKARIAWLQQHRGQTILQLPYYWAGFTYSGHLLPVVLPQAHRHYAWYGLAVVVIAAGGIVLVLRRRR